MSIGMFFYLVDLVSNLKVVLFIGLTVALVIILFWCMNCFLDGSNFKDDIEYIRLKKAIKYTWFPILITILLLAAFPSKQTMCIIGGERAVYAIAENKDNKEVIDLVKQITIKKLKELAKDGE